MTSHENWRDVFLPRREWKSRKWRVTYRVICVTGTVVAFRAPIETGHLLLVILYWLPEIVGLFRSPMPRPEGRVGDEVKAMMEERRKALEAEAVRREEAATKERALQERSARGRENAAAQWRQKALGDADAAEVTRPSTRAF